MAYRRSRVGAAADRAASRSAGSADRLAGCPRQSRARRGLGGAGDRTRPDLVLDGRRFRAISRSALAKPACRVIESLARGEFADGVEDGVPIVDFAVLRV